MSDLVALLLSHSGGGGGGGGGVGPDPPLLGVERVDPNIADYRGRTALHLAQSAAVAAMLLRAGADPCARNSEGRDPLAQVGQASISEANRRGALRLTPGHACMHACMHAAHAAVRHVGRSPSALIRNSLISTACAAQHERYRRDSVAALLRCQEAVDVLTLQGPRARSHGRSHSSPRGLPFCVRQRRSRAAKSRHGRFSGRVLCG
jgi:hypothetical protein